MTGKAASAVKLLSVVVILVPFAGYVGLRTVLAARADRAGEVPAPIDPPEPAP